VLQRGILQGLGSFKDFAISCVLDGAKTVFLIPLANFFGAVGAVAAVLGAGVMATVFNTVALLPRLGASPKDRTINVAQVFRMGGSTTVASFSIVTLMFYDVVLAKHYLDPLAAGLYSSAALAGRVLLAACSFIPIVLLPDITLRAASGRPDRHVLFAMVSVTLAIAAASSVACAWAPHLVITMLAGGRFLGAATLLLPYVMASGALAVANVLAMYAIGRRRFGVVPYILGITTSEIIAVTIRHGSASAIVQDILVGHAVLCLAIAIGITLSIPKSAPLNAA